MMKYLLLLAVLILWAGRVPAHPIQYNSAKCAEICRYENEFEERLPLEPKKDGGSRLKRWSEVFLNQVRDNFNKITPPGSGRAIGIFTSCLYDAVALMSNSMVPTYANSHVDEEYLLYHLIDGAAYAAISSMYSDSPTFGMVRKFLYQEIGGLHSHEGLSFDDFLRTVPDIEARSFERGRSACSQVIQEWTKDGFDPIGHEVAHTPNYSSVNDPQTVAGITDCAVEMKDFGRWQPICVPVEIGSDVCEPQKYLGPLADKMHTFALDNPEDVLPPPPPTHDDGEWHKQTRQVMDFSANLNDVNKLLAEHWADGPDTTLPPGHMFYIAVSAAEKQGLSIFETAKLYFLVGAALNDAGVGAWASKLKYDFVRPLQMIQCSYGGEYVEAWTGPYLGIGTIKAADWQPYQAETFKTPGFAAYVSGHSTFSAAAAAIMAKYFHTSEYMAPKCIRYEEGSSLFEGKIEAGEKNHIPGLTDVPNQGPHSKGYVPNSELVLCWETFEEAAEESGISRLHGGIHIIADHIYGKAMGNEIASRVFEKAQTLFSVGKVHG